MAEYDLPAAALQEMQSAPLSFTGSLPSPLVDPIAWQGPTWRADRALNPYVVVVHVHGRVRQAGSAAARWQIGWRRADGVFETVSELKHAGEAKQAQEDVFLKARSGPTTFKESRATALKLGLVASNIELRSVRVQVWGGGGAGAGAMGAFAWAMAALAVAAVAWWGLRWYGRAGGSSALPPPASRPFRSALVQEGEPARPSRPDTDSERPVRSAALHDGRTCPKCRHVRQPAERAPAGECPNCGVIYAKYFARQAELTAARADDRAASAARHRPRRRGATQASASSAPWTRKLLFSLALALLAEQVLYLSGLLRLFEPLHGLSRRLDGWYLGKEAFATLLLLGPAWVAAGAARLWDRVAPGSGWTRALACVVVAWLLGRTEVLSVATYFSDWAWQWSGKVAKVLALAGSLGTAGVLTGLLLNLRTHPDQLLPEEDPQ